MALRCPSAVLVLRSSCNKLRLFDKCTLSKVLPASCGQFANLTSSQGHPTERIKPWPYEKRPYNMWYQLIDKTTKRFDDNSKIIVIEGNIGVGKSQFGEQLAKEFDMKFIPDVDSNEIFFTRSGYDYRELDEQLPVATRSCDLPRFYTQNGPKNQLANISLTQVGMYVRRFFNYVAAMNHLLNTGQGVVIERSPWSDVVFADAMKKFSFMSKHGHTFYNLMRDNTSCELLLPHAVIYLDAPLSYVRQAINKRNVSWEKDSKVLNDEYLQAIDDAYKKKLLPYYKTHCEVLNYDVTDMLDWEIITEELECLELDFPPEGDENKLSQWYDKNEDYWSYVRMCMGCERSLSNLFNLPTPFDAQEMMISEEDMPTYTRVFLQNGEVKHPPGFNPVHNNVLLKF